WEHDSPAVGCHDLTERIASSSIPPCARNFDDTDDSNPRNLHSISEQLSFGDEEVWRNRKSPRRPYEPDTEIANASRTPIISIANNPFGVRAVGSRTPRLSAQSIDNATIKAEIANPGNGRYVRVGNAFYQATRRPQPRLTKPGEIRRCAGLRDLATSESRPPRRLELPEAVENAKDQDNRPEIF